MFLFWTGIAIIFYAIFFLYKDKIFFLLTISSLCTSVSCIITDNYFLQLVVMIISCSFLIWYCISVKQIKLFRKIKPVSLHNLIGKPAEVIEYIGNDSEQFGTVKLNGDIWFAKSITEDTFAQGSQVLVVGIKGLFVYVQKYQ
ncbi:MAG: hypothetical protein ATN35_08975 [Epulopiscium sp. Nele67-Bin004]|nr:MAG: hypothetical protein ATN35_08975 [Epulopiscium sp. Nele67-Bin004]